MLIREYLTIQHDLVFLFIYILWHATCDTYVHRNYMICSNHTHAVLMEETEFVLLRNSMCFEYLFCMSCRCCWSLFCIVLDLSKSVNSDHMQLLCTAFEVSYTPYECYQGFRYEILQVGLADYSHRKLTSHLDIKQRNQYKI